jgi:hypothetical protein
MGFLKGDYFHPKGNNHYVRGVAGLTLWYLAMPTFIGGVAAGLTGAAVLVGNAHDFSPDLGGHLLSGGLTALVLGAIGLYAAHEIRKDCPPYQQGVHIADTRGFSTPYRPTDE